MNGKRKVIGYLVFAVMSISFIVIFLFIHFFLRYYMNQEVYKSIRGYEKYLEEEYKNDMEDDTFWDVNGASDDTELFQVLYLEVSGDYSAVEDERDYFLDKKEIVEWCKKHTEQMKNIRRASVNGQDYYIEQIPYTYDYRGEHYELISILCVNVSTVEWMFQIAEIIMAAIMFLCICVASWCGFRMGRSIEEEQERQKRFFENASHELKTPLMSIQGYAEGLMSGVVKEQEHAYQVLMRETQRMAKLVDEILFLSKYGRKEFSILQEEISLGELVGDCLDGLKNEINKKGISIHLQIKDRFLTADEEQMHRAVSNIISNAIRYAKNTISIRFEDEHLVIWDDGDMLSEEELEKIFERFYKGKDGNADIGLALAKEIILAHGFTLNAENKDGGVQFVIGIK